MMTKDFFKMFSGMNDTEFEKMVENAVKIVKAFVDEHDDEKDEHTGAETYYKETKKEYNDGELVKKSEKEFVNGECTKNEEFDATKELGCDGSCSKCKCDDSKINSTILKNEELTKQIEDMTRYIDKLNDKINELEKKNANLNAIINNIKKCF